MKQLFLIPFFASKYHRTDPRMRGFSESDVNDKARLAALSYRSWQDNTDARSWGVDCKIYLQDILAPYVRGVFEQHDIEVMTYSCPNVRYARLSQFVCAFWDKRFRDCDQLFLSDFDVIIPRFEPDFFNFFERCGVYPNQQAQGLSKVWFKTNEEMRKTSRGDYLTYLEKSHKEKKGIDVLSENLKNHQLLTGLLFPVDIDLFLNPQTRLMFNSSAIWKFPAKRMHKTLPKLIEWLRSYALGLGNDEIIATTAYYLFPFEVFSLQDELDFRVLRVNDIASVDFKNLKNTVIHCKDLEVIQQVL